MYERKHKCEKKGRQKMPNLGKIIRRKEIESKNTRTWEEK